MHTGRLKRKFALDSLEATSCVFFENALWMLRGAYLNRAVEYSLSKMDCQTGNIQNLGTFYKESYDKGAIFLSKGNFSIYQGRLFFALNTGNTVYEIRGDKMVPYLQWQIEPNEHYFPQYEAICNKAKVGRYLFVNYRLMFLKGGEGDETDEKMAGKSAVCGYPDRPAVTCSSLYEDIKSDGLWEYQNPQINPYHVDLVLFSLPTTSRF